MPEDIITDKAKFDAMLQRLIQSRPTTLEQIKRKLRVKKEGNVVKRGKAT